MHNSVDNSKAYDKSVPIVMKEVRRESALSLVWRGVRSSQFASESTRLPNSSLRILYQSTER